ncbi:proline--tRNA ligase [Paenibacillus agricola]|uniref:Proline--tRNA ligase n=1 Tax=Paenibacillus agricola TaxID=2716264 RepID=A0ABX0JD17_9BACL|nr:proline--tRNA ligase [Paenibacillus agricola]NHN34052.1 proline--tRNA ligase [Paenibacillus agricola]
MRQSKLLLPTMREAPSDAEAISHQLLLRAGFIRQVAAGIYTYLPLGWRVLKKVADIIREEMDRTDAQEILMPAMQPADLWQESGRYAIYGPELIRLKDRHEREFVLGPTHEEVITALIRNEVNSYRQLPLHLYQIQTKFRDERRPRFGLLRGREFLMKDAYSFDLDGEGLDKTYWVLHEAYCRIFRRLGLNFRAVEADAGAIGGDGGTHEFMALADIGEDTIVSCESCDYAANLEKAESISEAIQVVEAIPYTEGSPYASITAYEKIHTPNVRTIEELVQALGVEAKQLIKTLLFIADGNPVAVLVRGDHEVNETKVKNALGSEVLELANAAMTEQITGAPLGFAGPIQLTIPLLVDKEVAAMPVGIVGANEKDYHLRNVCPSRDFPVHTASDFRNVAEGDLCSRCQGALQFSRGIELGHVFKLGTKYSKALGATYLDSSGKEQIMVMGCYGIGISRILSAVVEQNHDAGGILWPVSMAPYQVHLIPISVKAPEQMALAEQLYTRLGNAGIEVLLDDRDERAGVKFKDADLIGIPVRILVGKHAAEGLVEYKERGSMEPNLLGVEEAFVRIMELKRRN